MNDDLISRSKLIEELYSVAYACSDDNVNEILSKQLESNIECIKQQPAAYNVDKVVEQLEEENALYCAKFIICKKKGNDTLAKENLDRANLLDKAIEVVKAGGIDE